MIGWTIDRDLTGTPPSAVGITWGPDLANAPQVTADTPGAERFYAYDDDGNHYFSGWVVGDSAWDVILGWGMAYAGVAAIYDAEMQCIVG